MSVNYKCDVCGCSCDEYNYFPCVMLAFYSEPLIIRETLDMIRCQKTLTTDNQYIASDIKETEKKFMNMFGKLTKEWHWHEAGYCQSCLVEFHSMYVKYIGNMIKAFKKKIVKIELKKK